MKKTILLLLLALSLALTSCGDGGGDGKDNGNAPPTACDAHTDDDGNGRCDVCTVSVLVGIDLYAVNDLHGKIFDGQTHIGVDEMTTFLKGARASGDGMILLSSGDMWQGTAESNATQGAIVTDWMNEADFAAMTLGNHEFDWGAEYIERNAVSAEFPL